MRYLPSDAWMFAIPVSVEPKYDPWKDVEYPPPAETGFWSTAFTTESRDDVACPTARGSAANRAGAKRSKMKPRKIAEHADKKGSGKTKNSVRKTSGTAKPSRAREEGTARLPGADATPSLEYGNDNAAGTVQQPHLLALVQETVARYRMKSATHHALQINVHASDDDRQRVAENTPQFRLRVCFGNFSKDVPRLCRLQFRKQKPTRKVLVKDNGKFIPLMSSLAIDFPSDDAFTSTKSLQSYWNDNGKVFNWTSLPTELKEHIIQFCIQNPPPHPDWFHCRSAPRLAKSYTPHPCEVVESLGSWRALFLVSTQLRALTLRLCFSGSAFSPQGLCLTSSSLANLQRRTRRLEKHYQLLEPHGVPQQGAYHQLKRARQYNRHPRIFPELAQYATFKHGIRKICLAFDFISLFHFFKVTTGGFARFWRANGISYTVFEELPLLQAIVVLLPADRHGQWRDCVRQMGPPLFHELHPCPRALHRIVYEQVAAVLAPYQGVAVMPFLDDAEQERFNDLRDAAVLALQFTDAELGCLYADCGGGVELEDAEWDKETALSETRVVTEAGDGTDVNEGFFPIRCQCAVPCSEAFHTA